ncbi:hypothetical protein BKI52_15830 [marine bacterium AO1-C]|nr:hypothetical protein BKI52_15830 [marine bacterium AO1-C]
MSTYTNTYSQSNTYTEARARYIMGKVYEDTLGMWNAGLITRALCDGWRDDLLYLLDQQVLIKFEFQFKKPNLAEKVGLRYTVVSDGSIYSDDHSGGHDFFGLPSGTNASLVVTLNSEASSYEEANKELERRGWGNNGKSLTGNATSHGTYSKGGYGTNIENFGL